MSTLLSFVNTCTEDRSGGEWTVVFDLTDGNTTGVRPNSPGGTTSQDSSGLHISGFQYSGMFYVQGGDVTTRLLSYKIEGTFGGNTYSDSTASSLPGGYSYGPPVVEQAPPILSSFVFSKSGSPLAQQGINIFSALVNVGAGISMYNSASPFPPPITVLITKVTLKGDGIPPTR